MAEPQPDDTRLPAASTDTALLSSLSPWRSRFLIGGLWLSLFLSALETTIVTTALIEIGNEFKDFASSSWVIITYLLTYNAFILVLSKLSDTFGLKTMLIVSNIIFLIFSIACGASQTLEQLIVFRAFQGIGGSGLYSLVFTFIGKHVALQQMGIYSGVISSVFALASLVGPIVGGIITDNSTWRWIFYLNGPAASVALILLVICFPNAKESSFTKANLRKFDIIGAILTIGWAIPLVFGLEEGGVEWPWSSSQIIGSLVGGGVGLIFFLVWQLLVEKRGKQQPIFPIKLLKDPVISMQLLTIMFMGFSLFSAIILLPQRFQAVNGLSPSKSGLLLLPLTVVTAAASLPAGGLPGKWPWSVFPILSIGSFCIAAAIGLLSTLPNGEGVPGEQYGYMVLLGVGIGFQMPSLLLVVKMYVADADIASAVGASNMGRTLGGCIALSLASAIQNNHLSAELPDIVGQVFTDHILESVAAVARLPPGKVSAVREVFGEGYNKQFRGLLAFAVLGVVSSTALTFFAWRKGIPRSPVSGQATDLEADNSMELHNVEPASDEPGSPVSAESTQAAGSVENHRDSQKVHQPRPETSVPNISVFGTRGVVVL